MSESIKPDDPAQVQNAQDKKNFSCYQEIVKAFDQEGFVYKFFNTIPTGIFPCVFKTQYDGEYEKNLTFIASFDAEEMKVGILKDAFRELTDTIYPFRQKKHNVVVSLKWINHDNWLKPKKICRSTFGQFSSKEPELIQIIFCHERDFIDIIDGFDGLRFFKP